MIFIKKNKEYASTTPGVGIIVRAAPTDKHTSSKDNNFYIIDVITHTESVNGSVSYTRETKTMSPSEMREALGLGKRESIKCQ